MADNTQAAPRSTGKIFWASFLTLIAAGTGFGVRTAVMGEWGSEFGFTKTDLGTITGGGLTGMAFTIVFFSLFADRFGYRIILIGAFLLHTLSAIVTLAATPVFAQYGQNATYWCLYIGMFMFALGNGMCESAINPLVATLYPKQKTHYLNILHAGWPGGLIVGGLLAYCFVGSGAAVSQLRWEIPMLFFLIPTLWYGFITLNEKFPISEARAAGIRFGQMLAQFASPILLFLLVLHALVGYVELGTDSWIPDIMKQFFPNSSVLILVYTAGLMFVLRFFAGPIVEHINPLGLLFVSAILACIGLFTMGTMLSAASGIGIVIAATVYGIGKTFFWPTMLGVVGERFPKGGALTMGAMGGIGMLSAGMLGGPGIGYTQDVYAAKKLHTLNATVYDELRAKQPNHFLFFPPVEGLDGAKVAEFVKQSAEETPAVNEVKQATDYGGSMALKVTAGIPAAMAVGYLLLLIYFRAIGGYKLVEIGPSGQEIETDYSPTAEDAVYVDSRADQA